MYRDQKVTVLIPAAGSGRRMGGAQNKLMIGIAGRPVIHHTLQAFEDHPLVDEIVVITGEPEIAEVAQSFKKVAWVIEGGQSRQASIQQGLTCVQPDKSLVLVHDGARPNVSPGLISRVIEGADRLGAVIAAVKPVDTIKQVRGSLVEETLDRSTLIRVQTPQGFRSQLLLKAYAQATVEATDDATLIEQLGAQVHIVEGDERNIKVTVPADVDYLGFVKGARRMTGRVGTGYDVHRLVEDRKLILGGVEIPHEKGLLGHSDADVLLHAIMDALLGAAGEGDIGQWFPDSDDRFKGISSMELLKEVYAILKKVGWNIVNIDATVMAQRPKLAPFIPEMKDRISGALALAPERLNIKATTTERLGFVGREEGIAAQAAVMIDKS